MRTLPNWTVALILIALFSALSIRHAMDDREIVETVTGTDGQPGYRFSIHADDEVSVLKDLAENVPCKFDVMSMRNEAGTFAGLVRCQ